MNLRRWRRAAPLVAVALVLAGALAGGAAAQEDQEAAGRVVLRRVDATQPRAVQAVVTWDGDADAIADVEVRDGEDTPSVAATALADAGLSNDIYLVVDTSTSTDRNNLVSQARDAIEAFVADGLPPGTRVALLRAGNAVQTMQALTSDPARIVAAAQLLAPEGEGALLGGVAQAAGQAAQRKDRSISTVVLITDGVETPSPTVRQAATELKLGAALLHVIGLQAEHLDAGALTNLAQGTGGTFRSVSSATGIADALESLRPELTQSAVLTFATSARRGPQQLSVTVDGASTTGSYIALQSRVGFQELGLINIIEPGGHGPLGGDVGKLVGLVSAALALILFAYGVILIFVRQDEDLTKVLRPYSEGFVADSDGEDENQGMAQTALLQRAVAMTESFAEQRGVLVRVERTLEKASVPLRAGEAMFFYSAGVVLLVLLTAALTRNIVATLLVTVLVAMIPPAVLNALASNKKRKFEALLPDTLQLLSSTLKAGYSMMQGVEAVAAEAAEPMGAELRRVVAEARLGRPVEEAMEASAVRMDSKDFGWAVMAVRIQREVGGNLAELLLTVAETMTARERLRRDIRSLTAEGRMSAYVLIGLPIGLGLFLYSANPDYVGRLFDNFIGQAMVGGGLLAMVVGTLWMFKIIDIEV